MEGCCIYLVLALAAWGWAPDVVGPLRPEERTRFALSVFIVISFAQVDGEENSALAPALETSLILLRQHIDPRPSLIIPN